MAEREYGSPGRKDDGNDLLKPILRKNSNEEESLVQQPSIQNNNKAWLNYLGEKHHSNFFNSIGMSQVNSMYRPNGVVANQGTLINASLMQTDFLQAS
mmetsp:Transcript_3336/g.3900  ORF Transcript_3336/g.3900 Transcript_3336/m.3900 type:complete len:98 (+) Transcript_3336:566-859(+)|eukprot:CAMPEP_0170458774 /NCGR_PEP_ID=MMETSP0123-20130129/5650_1 /TAXON_ID=182087 /ORGANISM="Favella ehrenbergii, Strain Fehren 1" /LENGTH=97 /DNA_ID=CAMNT_0010723071 /DNA_START=754 /DNA_END=1047 /DNA_ORIENTATION=+